MMPYILVSLWVPGDEATNLAHAFAERLHSRCAAAAFLAGEHPTPSELQAACQAHPDAPIVILGHGGAALSAQRNGSPWIGPRELGQILSGRRVYALACSTFVPQPPLLMSTFADQAVHACIEVFVGHEASVTVPLADQSPVIEKMNVAICQMIERFVDGENEREALVNIGRMYAASDQLVEIDLPSNDPQRDGAFGWSSEIFLEMFFRSLRVRRK